MQAATQAGGGGAAGGAGHANIGVVSAGRRVLARHGGARGLWLGLGPSLAMTVPSTVLYLGAYERVRDAWLRRCSAAATTTTTKDAAAAGGGGGDGRATTVGGPPLVRLETAVLKESAAPLVAGFVSRAFASASTAPIEFATIQLQSGAAPSLGHVVSLIRETPSMAFTGLGMTVMRDAPFSALYWYLFSEAQSRAVAFVKEREEAVAPPPAAGGHIHHRGGDDAGRIGTLGVFGLSTLTGGVAAWLTNPLDVIKTRQQASMEPLTRVVRTLLRDAGPRGLMAGASLRVLKIVPGCGVMMSCYEAVRRQFTTVTFHEKG